MKKGFSFYPGRRKVSFRKGPSGHLRQDPSEEAMELKRRRLPPNTSPAQSQDTVKANALTTVMQRGGDRSDRQEVMGEYVLQFGKYRGKTFCWLLENDVGYVMYLFSKVEQEESEGTFNPQGHSKDSLLSLLEYAGTFQEIRDLRAYLMSRKPAAPLASEGDNVVGFGGPLELPEARGLKTTRSGAAFCFWVIVQCMFQGDVTKTMRRTSTD